MYALYVEFFSWKTCKNIFISVLFFKKDMNKLIKIRHLIHRR